MTDDTKTAPDTKAEPSMLDHLHALIGSAELKALWADESAWTGLSYDSEDTIVSLVATLPATSTRPALGVMLQRARVVESPECSDIHAALPLRPSDGCVYSISCSSAVDVPTIIAHGASLAPDEIEDMRRAFGDLLVWQ